MLTDFRLFRDYDHIKDGFVHQQNKRHPMADFYRQTEPFFSTNVSATIEGL